MLVCVMSIRWVRRPGSCKRQHPVQMHHVAAGSDHHLASRVPHCRPWPRQVGSVFEYTAQHAAFGVIQPDSPLYALTLGTFAVTGLPTSGEKLVVELPRAASAAQWHGSVVVFQPGSPLYALVLGTFAATGLPTSGRQWAGCRQLLLPPAAAAARCCGAGCLRHGPAVWPRPLAPGTRWHQASSQSSQGAAPLCPGLHPCHAPCLRLSRVLAGSLAADPRGIRPCAAAGRRDALLRATAQTGPRRPPLAGYLFWRAIRAANQEAERMDKLDGY